ncbi:TPA: helix-turn-helix domain-containing protein [Klebsiella variicola subsp. variicola]|nr:helix-turn-helix domain-containing protein [Klebsiella variicola subsp. variicola]HCI6648113.1 helix-turn-helix domain-containing protein [Klebsiella variicola subsp. variicola]
MLVTMTDKELYRLGIIQRVFDRALLQRDAADILELSVRQVQRLVRLYRTDGATAFASSHRGRPANNRIDEETRCKALDLIRCHYSDFGPTLATEKLAERHHIHLSVETVRNWVTADGLWRPHSRRQTRVYQPRYRRDCLGELVQIDGSHHDWFEGRAPKCCLLVFMDVSIVRHHDDLPVCLSLPHEIIELGINRPVIEIVFRLINKDRMP